MKVEYVTPIILNVVAIVNSIWSLTNVIRTRKTNKRVTALLKKAEEVNKDTDKYFQMTLDVYHQEVERFRKKVEEEEKTDERI